MSTRIFRFDGWTLDPQSGELERDGECIRLQEQPLQLLAALLVRPGELVSREQLISRLWPDTVVDFDMGLNTAVYQLRVALADTGDVPRYIETLPRGYRFIAALKSDTGMFPALPVSDPKPAVAAMSVPAEQDSDITVYVPRVAPRSPYRVRYAKIAVAIVLGLAALGTGWLLRSGILHSPTAAVTAHGSSPIEFLLPPPPHSVAVLPFMNTSGDSTREYFCHRPTTDASLDIAAFPKGRSARTPGTINSSRPAL